MTIEDTTPSRWVDERVARVRAALAAERLDALVVGDLANLYYLTALRSSAGLAVVETAPDAAVHLVLDARYQTVARELMAARQTPAGLRLVPVQRTYDETLAAVLETLGPRRVGIEADRMSVRQWRWLQRHTRVELVPTIELVARHRMIKDAGEIARLRLAGARLAALIAPALDLVRAGRREREVARDVDRLVVDAGFEGTAFETIVASGPHSAWPHARPTDRRLTDGDLVILDFGGVLEGYCVDVSRTVAVGRVTSETTRLHDAVREAQMAALAAAAPGVAASAVDGAARRVLGDWRLAEAFGHGTGHGLGLEVHELPRIARVESGDAEATGAPPIRLRPGMVFTVEPGVYVPGVGGVRIEDDVLVTDGGLEVLTPAARQLVVT